MVNHFIPILCFEKMIGKKSGTFYRFGQRDDHIIHVFSTIKVCVSLLLVDNMYFSKG